MPGYGARYWAERTADNRRRSHPKFRGQATSDVVIIGGGLTGCAMAYAISKAGFGVTLLEADRVAAGGTSGGIGAIVPQPDAWLRDVASQSGRRPARAAWEGTAKAAKDFAAVLAKLPLKSDVSDADFFIDAPRVTDVAALRREQAARRSVGVVGPWLPQQAARAALGSDSYGAIRLGDAARYDPVRATLALASAAQTNGAMFYEHSTVLRTRFTRKEATVILGSGRIRTKRVIVATADPGAVFHQLGRHVRRSTGYVVITEPLTAAMRRETGDRKGVITEAGADPHWLRWLPDDRAVFAGALSKPLPSQKREKALIQRTAQLMYELSVRYPVISGLPAKWSWDVPVVTTPDTLPWIGPHRNYPFHFFAIALGWHGDALAWLAAKAAVRNLKGEAQRDDEALGFARYL